MTNILIFIETTKPDDKISLYRPPGLHDVNLIF